MERPHAPYSGYMRFQFRYDGVSGPLLRVLGLGPKFSYIDVADEALTVRMSWGFRATVPRSSVRSATLSTSRLLSRGVHGWNGRWLVNGSGKGLVTIAIEPRARAYCLGVPVRLRQLTVSASTPHDLIDALTVG